MPDKEDPRYVPLWVDHASGVQPMVDGKGGYLAEQQQRAPLEATLSSQGQASAAPKISPEAMAKAVNALGGAKKKKKEPTLEEAAKAMEAEVRARNAAMAAQPSAVAGALQRDASVNPEHGTPRTGYELPLSHEDEPKFSEWKQKYAPNDSGGDYDLRGAYKAGFTPGPDGHWLDTFKKPNHPTFSDESVYAEYAPEKAGKWDGDRYVPHGKK